MRMLRAAKKSATAGKDALVFVQIVATDTQHDAEIADGDHGRAADPGNRAGVAQTDIAEFGGQPDGGKYPQHQFGNA